MTRVLEPRPRLHVATADFDGALRHLDRRDVPATAGMPGWRAREYLAGRSLLRHLLRTAAAALDAAVAVRPSGQPWLPGLPGTFVSISHSGGRVAAALGPRPVGVDIQTVTTASEALLRRCCPPATATALRATAPARRAALLARVWTAQEASVKVFGRGLAAAPWRIPVDPYAPTGSWRGITWERLTAGPRHALAVAYASPQHREQEPS
ncbi:4'-phosphopantetheinyl transferase superfamily protein [Streptomyces sp. TRM 70351]|uniref:4'-phosphopantetheinyl transferase family protein n=1 Tax=Streptomyces sp. TRM 70351 TaxID=3116552 RepID=UPI002E7BEA7A|nr:4'-phosphopantetheinyl transferase superfamily protein [Streptomyces sp. TRM 70351]MEE1927858.1 4'-phosphopantetheinyl transferase superfamily protein [Streptomyces sp. TRM 70351]